MTALTLQGLTVSVVQLYSENNSQILPTLNTACPSEWQTEVS